MLKLVNNNDTTTLCTDTSSIEIHLKENVLLDYVTKFLNKIDFHPMFPTRSKNTEELIYLDHDIKGLHSLLILKRVGNNIIFEYNTHILVYDDSDRKLTRNLRIANCKLRCTKDELIKLI